ncbi:MAG: BolA family protein [Pseudomonadota bacterium]
MSDERINLITESLVQNFKPSHLQIIDQSHLHAGHAGAKDGRGHFKVNIVSGAFEGMRPLQIHQAIYAALGSLMETDIHALSINARAEPN